MIDAADRVTGRAAYVLNDAVPGMLVGVTLRSPFPHARIAHVDASVAEHLTGVVAVLTRNDFKQGGPSPYFGPYVKDMPVVAIDKVRYAGEPVAAVAAVDADTAREALGLIEVEYEELPAVFDARSALAPDAPLIHERGNVLNHVPIRMGDVEHGFAISDYILEGEYTSPPVHHVPLEPHVAIAEVSNGRITVRTATQTPNAVQAQIASMFRVPLGNVRVVVQTLGGGYGAKCYPRIEPLTVALSWKARQPVRVELGRDEVFRTLTKHAAIVRLKTGVKRDGTLVASQGTCHYNTGAYADVGATVAYAGSLLSGPYRVPHVSTDVYAVFTNLVPAGAFRGYGVPQTAWAYDTQLDRIAAHLGIDPVELRLKNALQPGDLFGGDISAPELHCRELLEDASRAVGWGESATRRRGSLARGKGVALVMKGIATPTTSSASVKLNSDGSLDVLTSSVEMGQGARTVLAQIAADGAGVCYGAVSVSCPDTASTPYDQSTSSSRTTFVMGTAVKRAAEEVKRQILALAAEQLEASPADLLVEDGRVRVKGVPERSLDYTELIRRSGQANLLGHNTFISRGRPHPRTGEPHGSAQYHAAAAACEVEVDLETGHVKVTRFHVNTHAGVVVNPTLAELQLEGSVLFGLGQALFEEMVFDAGQLQNGNLGDYMVPYVRDVPSELTVRALENVHADEIHGIGEQCLPPVAPAIGNAIANATGVRLTQLPITAERILRAIRNSPAET
jgi:CO/xanthine dehydrogenase Mo-binding subunit